MVMMMMMMMRALLFGRARRMKEEERERERERLKNNERRTLRIKMNVAYLDVLARSVRNERVHVKRCL